MLTTALLTWSVSVGRRWHSGCCISSCFEVCYAVCPPLCAGRYAPYVCYSLFFCCGDLFVSNGHESFPRNKERKSTPFHPMYRMWPVPCLGKTKGARGSLYSARVLSYVLPFPSSLSVSSSRSTCGVNLSSTLSLTLTPTTTNCSDDISSQSSLPLNRSPSFRSSFYILFCIYSFVCARHFHEWWLGSA